ncbi:hypothetical protein ED28_15585 [[Pantoea] beijingensis]|uniref:Uncharacterized protein n=1 Tax=[Pantoea] beijingensis TaxID=1324864 RepID=A0A443IA20_9GAMM|nr:MULTISPECIES: hypothetical protein [Erwiniaceae]RWR00875.1 hypothetical protein ED28_15585 [[Pantoea] beijingensis]
MHRQRINQTLNPIEQRINRLIPPALENPLPPQAKKGLHEAALRYGASSAQASLFSAEGRITLDAITVTMVCLRSEPVPFWLLIGYLPPPQALHLAVWHHALLRSNEVSMAMNGSSFGIDQAGNAILTKPLLFNSPEDIDELATCLNDFNTLASSLIDLLLSLKAPEVHASPVPTASEQTGEAIQLAQKQMHKTWHNPLMVQLCEELGPAARLSVLHDFLCVIDLPERQITLIGDGDERHLLVATPVHQRFSEEKMHVGLLRANSELMPLSHCAFSLSSAGISLLSRQNSDGQSSAELASWLADFVTLATACDLPPPAAPTNTR